MIVERFPYDVSEGEEMAVDKVNLCQHFFSTGGHQYWVEMLCKI
jgi:hypothetical protein